MNDTTTTGLNTSSSFTTNVTDISSSSSYMFCIKHIYTLRMIIGIGWLVFFVVLIFAFLIFMICKLKKRASVYTKVETEAAVSGELNFNSDDPTREEKNSRVISNKLFLRATGGGGGSSSNVTDDAV